MTTSTAPRPAAPAAPAVPSGAWTGEWAVILGASSGMGAAVAQRLAAEGANVLGVHFDTAARDDDIAELVTGLRQHGGDIRYVNANATSATTRAAVLEQLSEVAAGPGVRFLMHSLAFGTLLPFLPPPGAAPGPDGEPAPVLSSRQLTMTVEVMAHSLVWWVQDLAAAGLLRPGSHVLAMTSAGDSRVSGTYGAVSAAKSALLSHVRQLSVELAPMGVAVNALRAGVTLTPSLLRIPESEKLVAVARAANPHGRLTTPEDVAEAVAVLTASRSSWLTGNVIGVDGGEGLTT
jgi:enoyl-[acyl-carrier protein] reductase III